MALPFPLSLTFAAPSTAVSSARGEGSMVAPTVSYGALTLPGLPSSTAPGFARVQAAPQRNAVVPGAGVAGLAGLTPGALVLIGAGLLFLALRK